MAFECCPSSLSISHAEALPGPGWFRAGTRAKMVLSLQVADNFPLAFWPPAYSDSLKCLEFQMVGTDVVPWINTGISMQNPKPGNVCVFSLIPNWREVAVPPWYMCCVRYSFLLVQLCQCEVHVALTQTHALQQDHITLKVIFR